jgi:signal transduction histidine kinase
MAKIKKSKMSYFLLAYISIILTLYLFFLNENIKNLYFFNSNPINQGEGWHFYKISLALLIIELGTIVFLNSYIIFTCLFIVALKKIKMFIEHLNFDPHHSEPLKHIPGPKIVHETFNALNKMQKKIIGLFEKHTKTLTMIIHDLRTPLTRIKLRIQLLEKTQNIEKLIKNINEIEHMLSDILWFARNTFEREKKCRLDLKLLLNTICEDYHGIGYTIHFDTKEIQTDFFGKPRALKRAFVNIIENALKYAHAQPVFVTLNVQDNTILIIIRDQGKGIADSELEHVFKPYYQGKHNKRNGFGLGLAIVKDIVTSHQGTISLKNHHECGLEVSIALKIYDPPLKT